VTQDYKEAIKWWRKAADQGNDWAQEKLGYMYQYGQGVAQDYKEAMKWYRKAVVQGNDRAQKSLGYIKKICDETPSACEFKKVHQPTKPDSPKCTTYLDCSGILVCVDGKTKVYNIDKRGR
jgi:TPR repeat protein